MQLPREQWLAVLAADPVQDGAEDVGVDPALAVRNRDLCGRVQEALANARQDDLGSELQARMVAAAMVAAFTGLDEVEAGEDKMALVDQALDFVRGGIASLQGTTG